MDSRRYTIIAPTTGGAVWIERIRARPRLKASYAALKGDFRPLALTSDYHNFVSGPLAAHGLVDGAHELLISEDIDSGRSWEIPVLIAHLLENAGVLQAGGEEQSGGAASAIIWATGSVDPELNPQAADYSVARKCELAAPLFAEWRDAGRPVHLVVPQGMPETDRTAVAEAAAHHGFTLSEIGDFKSLKQALGLPAAGANSAKPWRQPAVRVLVAVVGLLAGAGALWFLNGSSGSGGSSDVAGINRLNATEGQTSPITLIRLGAKNRTDCIERIMLTQSMERTTIALRNGAYRVPGDGGLCGLRFINQSPQALSLRITGDLVNAAIQGNDSLFQGVVLPASDATDLIFSRSPAGLTASLRVDGTDISVIVETPVSVSE